MRKRLASRKRKVAPKRFSYYFFRFVISVFIVSIIVGAVSFLRNFKSSHICANSISCIKDLQVRVENDVEGIFGGEKVVPPKIDLAQERFKSGILGEATPSGEKRIYVDLTHQTLYAYEGEKLILKTLISSGKWFPTPEGDYTIWIKLRATRMTGGTGGDYYDLPNVPYTMFFYNKEVEKSRGFALHGAYWHNNFGHPMSHGCVNMRIVDAETIYHWADPKTTSNTTYATDDNPGTLITIFGKAPLF